MWDEKSALWRAITQSGEDIPKFEEIALPGYMKYGSTQNDVKPAANNTSMFLKLDVHMRLFHKLFGKVTLKYKSIWECISEFIYNVSRYYIPPTSTYTY